MSGRWSAAAAGLRKKPEARRRDFAGICQRDSCAFGPAFHFRRSGCGGGVRAGFPIWIQARFFPLVENLDHALDTVRKDHPGYEIAVTGLSAIAARNSASMIEKLNRGLTIEFALVASSSGWRSARWS